MAQIIITGDPKMVPSAEALGALFEWRVSGVSMDVLRMFSEF
jgi:hypothetical protein